MNTDLAALRELVRLHNERGSHSHGDESKADQEARYKAWVAACYEAMPALSRLLEAQAGVPEGWQLVPVEPTKEMIEAGDNSRLWVEEDGPDWRNTVSTYKAMLAAAPNHPPSEGEAHD
jgi:hypothetical protein